MAYPVIRLGPFELEAPIGKGAMGEVWRGVHRAQQIPVAVKVMTSAQALVTEYRMAFRNEVQAVARLNHPGIVMVFDLGDVPEAAEKASDGRIVAGSPYLVMELATQGSLEEVAFPLPWHKTKVILLSLLDALAHAHARGVIHRDLKPGNVLLGSEADTRPGIKLTDFGIAHALEAQTRTGGMAATMSSNEEVMGSPYYMSPEQFHGHWRDYGPWTDLYALGCMAFELVTGHPPFDANTFLQMGMLHMTAAAPPLCSPEPLPQGAEEWILRLLEKDPARRFQRAADAAWQLMIVGDLGDTGSPWSPISTAPRFELDSVDATLSSNWATTWKESPQPDLRETVAEADTSKATNPVTTSGGDPLEPAVRRPADPLLHESQKGSRESETQQCNADDRRSKIRPAPYGKGTHDGDLQSDQAEREQEERPYAKVDLLHQSD